MTTPTTCKQCGAPLGAAGSLEGRCPRCLLAFGLGDAEHVVTRGARAVPPPTPDELREHFPELEVEELLGAGGMGAVYRARQRSLDRTVALKILRGDVADDPAFEERFHREARALARLNHPGIVAVHDSGVAGPWFYLLMEYVDGANLRSVLRSGELSSDEALRLVAQICDALQFAHREGVVHRDIKPENILVTTEGIVKIADFGLAKLVGGGVGDVSLTETAAAVGTMHYMAPEQIERPGTVDHRADIYSLGVVFYELLTGELPLGRFMPPSEKVEVDVRLDEVVLKTLAKEPERRYQAADDIKTDVHRISKVKRAKGRCGPLRFGAMAAEGEGLADAGGAAIELAGELSREEKRSARRQSRRERREQRRRERREGGHRRSPLAIGCAAFGCLGFLLLLAILVIPFTLMSTVEPSMTAPFEYNLFESATVGEAASGRAGDDYRASVDWVRLEPAAAERRTYFPAEDPYRSLVGQRPVAEWPDLTRKFENALGLSAGNRTLAHNVLKATFSAYLIAERDAVFALESTRDGVSLRIAAFPDQRDDFLTHVNQEMSKISGSDTWKREGGRELMEAVMPFGDEAAAVRIDVTDNGYFVRHVQGDEVVLQSSELQDLAPPYSRLFEWYRKSE